MGKISKTKFKKKNNTNTKDYVFDHMVLNEKKNCVYLQM